MLCNYGCGQEAIKQFGNGKWCCSESKNSCPVLRKKNSKSLNKVKDKLSKIRKKFLNTPKMKRKMSKIQRKIQNKLDVKEKQSKSHKKSWKDLEVRNRCIDSQIKSWRINQKRKENLRHRMKNGGASHALSFIKNPSIPQSTICKNVELLFPNLTIIINYPFLNYSLDTVILEHKIVVEYDGWYYHEGPLGDPKKDIERQKRCEEQGWKFIRYGGLKNRDIVPSLEQLKKDIEILMRS